jgi:hypothetical protein
MINFDCQLLQTFFVTNDEVLTSLFRVIASRREIVNAQYLNEFG